MDLSKEFNGVISKIKKQCNNDPKIILEKVIPTANSPGVGELNTVVLWNASRWTAKEDNYEWIELTFPQKYLFPSSYSIRANFNSDYCFAKRWSVYGIKEGDENNMKKWRNIGNSTYSDNSSFCRRLNTNGICKTPGVGTYKLNITHQKEGFRSIRWVLREGSCKNTSILAMSAIEIYGKLVATRFKEVDAIPKVVTTNVQLILQLIIISVS